MFPQSLAALTDATPGLGGQNNAEAIQQIGFDQLIHHFDLLGWIVFVVLVTMSISSWYFIIANALRNSRIRFRAGKVVANFWQTNSIQEAIRALEAQPSDEPFSKIALDAAAAAAHHQKSSAGRLAETLSRAEFIDRALRQAVARESLRLEKGLTLLATVGASAPFIGLLGTVWGIYHALIRMSFYGSASLETVAGPVGQSLVMTAFGLFTAIPAVLAYNFFIRANRLTYAKFDAFAHDLHDYFVTGARSESAPMSK